MEAQSMIERVAEAIQQASFRMIRPAWDSLDSSEKEQWIMRAKAAIQAMREPTSAMMNALANMPFRVVDVQFNQAHYSPRKLEWQAAIDAALNENGEKI